MVLATGAFTANDCCMKFVAQDLPVAEVLFVRSTFSMVLLLAAAALAGRLASLRRSFQTPVLVRGGAEFFGTLMFVTALIAVPIGTVTAIAQVVPIVVTLLGAFILSEKVGLHRWAAVVVGFVGAILVAGPSREGMNTYTLLAFGVPLIVALRDLVARSVGARIAVLPMLFGLTFMLLLGSVLAAPFGEAWQWPQPRQFGLLAGAALFAVVAHGGIVLALRFADMADVAPFYFMQTLWGVLAGIVVFGETPSWIALVGILFILGAGLYILHRERIRRRRPTPPPLVA